MINRVAAAAVTAVIGMTTPSLQRDFGNLFEHLSDPSQSVHDGRLGMVSFTTQSGQQGSAEEEEEEEEDGGARDDK